MNIEEKLTDLGEEITNKQTIMVVKDGEFHKLSGTDELRRIGHSKESGEEKPEKGSKRGRGRPKKISSLTGNIALKKKSPRCHPRKLENLHSTINIKKKNRGGVNEPGKRKRGRPKKNKEKEIVNIKLNQQKRKRGRPKKLNKEQQESKQDSSICKDEINDGVDNVDNYRSQQSEQNSSTSGEENPKKEPKRGRGRPRKLAFLISNNALKKKIYYGRLGKLGNVHSTITIKKKNRGGINESGKRKRGRPRKNKENEIVNIKLNQQKRKRGRPKKLNKVQQESKQDSSICKDEINDGVENVDNYRSQQSEQNSSTSGEENPKKEPKRGRGRPRKLAFLISNNALKKKIYYGRLGKLGKVHSTITIKKKNRGGLNESGKRKRGRPRKNKENEIVTINLSQEKRKRGRPKKSEESFRETEIGTQIKHNLENITKSNVEAPTNDKSSSFKQEENQVNISAQASGSIKKIKLGSEICGFLPVENTIIVKEYPKMTEPEKRVWLEMNKEWSRGKKNKNEMKSILKDSKLHSVKVEEAPKTYETFTEYRNNPLTMSIQDSSMPKTTKIETNVSKRTTKEYTPVMNQIFPQLKLYNSNLIGEKYPKKFEQKKRGRPRKSEQMKILYPKMIQHKKRGRPKKNEETCRGKELNNEVKYILEDLKSIRVKQSLTNHELFTNKVGEKRRNLSVLDSSTPKKTLLHTDIHNDQKGQDCVKNNVAEIRSNNQLSTFKVGEKRPNFSITDSSYPKKLNLGVDFNKPDMAQIIPQLKLNCSNVKQYNKFSEQTRRDREESSSSKELDNQSKYISQDPKSCNVEKVSINHKSRALKKHKNFHVQASSTLKETSAEIDEFIDIEETSVMVQIYPQNQVNSSSVKYKQVYGIQSEYFNKLEHANQTVDLTEELTDSENEGKIDINNWKYKSKPKLSFCSQQ